MAALGDSEEVLSEPNQDCAAGVATRRRAIDCRAESGAICWHRRVLVERVLCLEILIGAMGSGVRLRIVETHYRSASAAVRCMLPPVTSEIEQPVRETVRSKNSNFANYLILLVGLPGLEPGTRPL